VELFCGLPASSPLDFIFDAKTKAFVDLGTDPSQYDSKIKALRENLHMMHRKASEAREQQTRRNKRKQKKEVKPNFGIGDYVLRSRVDQKHNDKLLVTWIGPYQVVGTDTHSFRVRHLVTGAETDVHPSRLKFYADDSYEVTEEIKEHVAAQGIILNVAALEGHRWNEQKGDYELLVEWIGLEPIENSWESLGSLHKDIPKMIDKYAAGVDDEGLSGAVKKLKKNRDSPGYARSNRTRLGYGNSNHE
jgi:hypothetical protein